MVPFDYIRPLTIEHLIEGLREAGTEGAVLAGGTDLHVKMRAGALSPRVLFDIGSLETCRHITENHDVLRIGAAVSMSEIMASAAVRHKAPSLAAAVQQMSSRQIRNRATLGGNIITASPAADAVPPLLAADARLVLHGVEGRREVALAEFLRGPGKTSLESGEVLTEVVIPTDRAGWHSAFAKVGRRKAQAISVINVAGRVEVGPDGLLRNVRIALGAVGPTAMRAHRAEERLTGRAPSPENLAEAAALAAEECRPISDIRATERGRRLLVEAWTLRLLQQLCAAGAAGGCDS